MSLKRLTSSAVPAETYGTFRRDRQFTTEMDRYG